MGKIDKNIETNKEEKNSKLYIYLGKEITQDGLILKNKSFYTEEQVKLIKNKITNFSELENDFIDFDDYSKSK